MLPNAFEFKKVITDRVLQPKLNAQQVKQEAAATQHVSNVQEDCFKMLLVTQHAVNAPVDGVTKPEVLPHAMLYLLVPTCIVGMVKFMNVMLVIFVLVKRSIKLHVHPGRTQKQQGRYHALSVHRVRMQLPEVL